VVCFRSERTGTTTGNHNRLSAKGYNYQATIDWTVLLVLYESLLDVEISSSRNDMRVLVDDSSVRRFSICIFLSPVVADAAAVDAAVFSWYFSDEPHDSDRSSLLLLLLLLTGGFFRFTVFFLRPKQMGNAISMMHVSNPPSVARAMTIPPLLSSVGWKGGCERKHACVSETWVRGRIGTKRCWPQIKIRLKGFNFLWAFAFDRSIKKSITARCSNTVLTAECYNFNNGVGTERY